MLEPPEKSTTNALMESETHSGDPMSNRNPSNGSTEVLESLPNPTLHDPQDAKPQNGPKNQVFLTCGGENAFGY
jgi:hypothetical protein